MQSDKALADYLAAIEKQVADAAKTLTSVYVVTSSQLMALYPVANYEDARADAAGHIPYTQEFFNALGTMIARRFYGLQGSPYKVIVLDCDNTLWRGICGEDGTLGVKVDPAARALQEFVLAQRNAGVLLCLCSKNNEDDVWKVFEQNSGMALRRDHIVASRINWLPKPENLQSLAGELKLGLDSFIFLDDSALECAEVQAVYPQVLTLQVPQESPASEKFLGHIWAFDRLPVTDEDRRRSELYQQEIDRAASRKESMSLEDFLAGLDLHLEISPLEKSDIPRVAQLSQRTNQFNFTTIRRSESEIETLCDSGAECLVVRLRDRFGDYGTVGAMIFAVSTDELNLDSLFLSCRALGRRVEHRMLAELGMIAQQRGVEKVRINFAVSPKNAPAREFLESIGLTFEDNRTSYSWEMAPPTLVNLPSSAKQKIERSETQAALAQPSHIFGKSSLFTRIATQLSDPAGLARAIAAQRPVKHRDDATYIAPATPFEEFLASAWQDVLHVDRVGSADNFFDLGGQSLAAMQIAFNIQEEFHVAYSLDIFLQNPVLAAQAQSIEEMILEQADPDELAQFIDEIGVQDPVKPI